MPGGKVPWGLFARLLFLQGLLHPRGMQNLGFANALANAIGVEHNSMLKNHLEFFNCNPNFTPLIVGGVLRLEWERRAGNPVSEQDIEYFKKSVSAPLAAMGDLLFLGALKPLALTFACIFAIYQSYTGLLAIILLYNAVVVSCRLWGVRFGFSKGWELVDVFSGPGFQRLLGVVQSVGACAAGALVAIVLRRLAHGGSWVVVLGVGLLAAAVYLLRRDASSARFAVLLYPLSILIAALLK